MRNKTPKPKAERLLQVPTIFRELLLRRGVEGDEALGRFLYPQLVDLPKPEKMQNLIKAAHLVVEYITARKQIVIWGDYDVDGTTGTSLLVNFFRECNILVSWHIPNRLTEGYGLNIEWFQQERKTSLSNDFLLITVDCGISNCHEIDWIQKIGGTVIVTDHHSLPETGLPECLILNHSSPTCGFHGEKLAGVGMAFYLAAGIRSELAKKQPFAETVSRINLKRYLAFVALGTIADVVDLTYTNRILVRAGLEALCCTNFPGLEELLISCDIDGRSTIVSEDIGFSIGPKINAAGRLGESDLVVNLLIEENRSKAKKLAIQLTALNEKRKKISAENLEATLAMISVTQVNNDKCVITKGALHQGVAGIIASKIVEVFGFPAIVFAQKELPDKTKVYIGSARSVEGVNMIEMLNACANLIERFGGHEMAAGLTVSASLFNSFSATFSAIAIDKWQSRQIKKKRTYDIECAVEKLMSDEYLDFLKLMEPFGPGNMQPIFQDSQATIVDSRTIGRASEHLQLTIRGKFANLKGIGFWLGSKISEVQKESERILIYAPTINRYRGNVSWQVRVLDV